MNFSEKLILAGLAVSLLVLPACERGGGPPPPKESRCKTPQAPPGAGNGYGRQDRQFNVYIYTDLTSSQCFADVNVATLWTRTKKVGGQPVHQTVCWNSDDGKEYTIDFRPDQHYPDKRGSPFTHTDDWFYVPAGGAVASEDLKPDSTGYYAFAILPGHDLKAEPCKDASDPGYRVSP